MTVILYDDLHSDRADLHNDRAAVAMVTRAKLNSVRVRLYTIAHSE